MKNILLIIAVISAPLSAQSMLEVLADGPLEKKTEAMLHMGYAGNKSGFWYYVKYLNYSQKENDSHDIVMARCAAAEALGRIKDDRAIKYLTERFSVEKSDTVKAKILFALSFYKSPDIIHVLSSALDSENENVKFQAILTSSVSGDTSLAGKIENVKNTSKDTAFTSAAAFFLANNNIDRDKNVQMLKDLLKDINPDARFWSARNLSLLDETSAIPDLVRAAEIENKYWAAIEIDMALNHLYFVKREKRSRRLSEQTDFVTDGSK
ncbi:MAG: HEAT repeat domain-containing protein [Spirochaetes bacterium]|nr:HEAT repeat domain-containing protein [Spirochaetota bacterium]